MLPIRSNAAIGAGDITRETAPRQSSSLARNKKTILTGLLGRRSIIVIDGAAGQLASGLKEAISDWDTMNLRL